MQLNSQHFEAAVEAGQLLYQQLHAAPELSGAERQTAGLLREKFVALGYSIREIPRTHSFLALPPWPCDALYGLRAELDALPIQEETGVKFCSRNAGVMHACGHDAHMAIAYALAHYQNADASCRLPLFFTFESGEEVLPGGAKAIRESAAFRELPVEGMLALHCDPDLPLGSVGSRSGVYMASGDEVYITVQGVGGHGALPSGAVDPVLTGAHLLVALQSVASRYAPEGVPTILSFGKVEARGAMNVIPERVRMEGTFRTFDEAWRSRAKERIATMSQGVSAAFGARAEVDIRSGYPMLRNDHTLHATLRQVLQNGARGENYRVNAHVELPLRTTTDDFAYFAQEYPSLFLRLGVGEGAGLHTSRFLPADGFLACGLELMLRLLKAL